MDYIFIGGQNEFMVRLLALGESQGFSVQVISEFELKLHKASDFALLVCNTTNYHLRTFSVPQKQPFALSIQLVDSSDNKLFLHNVNELLRRICLAYSDAEVSAVLGDMPLLNIYAQRYVGVLSGFSLIWRDHFLEENISLLHAFEILGIQPCDILALDKGDSTLHRSEITETFIYAGYQVHVMDNGDLMDKERAMEYQNLLNAFLNKRRKKSCLVLDDGAIVTKLLDSINIDKILCALELTEMGLRRINQMPTLAFPVYNLAKTELKKCFTYKEIANSVYLRIESLLGASKLIGRSIAIIGYGDLGCILAKIFRAHGANVIICDNDYIKLLIAAENGFKTYPELLELVSRESPFMLVGATGNVSIDRAAIEKLQDNSFVTAAATADLHAFLELDRDNEIECYNIKRYGTQYVIKGKTVTLLGNGRSINLFESEAIPNQSNDLFKAATLLVSINCISDSSDNIIELDKVNRWLRSEGIYEEYYNLYIAQMSESRGGL
jgi:adenosylhomocysteinase